MGLIDLKTDLKSLKYSKDRIGGGSSKQPFVQKSIPDNFSAVGNTGGLDVLTRGGSLVFEKTADGYQIILHTKNKVVPRDSKKASVEFDDFIKIHVNSLGKMDALWQGSGVHQNMMPHIS